MKLFLYIFIAFFCSTLYSQNAERPKIGLSLSGGGAKGLAHIGLLKAIDSVGLKVDYISGTSMGAVIGGLYAVGYSGNEIEEIVQHVNWAEILSNKPPYDYLILPKKNDAGKHFEVPIVNGKLSFQKGYLESNELWLLLNELFYPYLSTTDFSKFRIPFRSVAADFETGDTVVLKGGNIVKAIRASMSIPGAFTPVVINGKTLIDGGIAMNFPVSEVRDMGADFVIGSSVTSPLLKSTEFNSPFQVVKQLAFYKEKKDFEKQVESTDLFVDYPIEHYKVHCFSAANEIIQIGIEKGKELYPRLKQFKDSLDLIYGVEQPEISKEKEMTSYYVSNIITTGLNKEAQDFLYHTIEFKNHKKYTAHSISKKIRTVFGSEKFRKITYEIIPSQNNEEVTLKLDFERKPKNIVIAGLHYSNDTGIALKLGYSISGTANPFTGISFIAAIGENPQVNITHRYFFNKKRNWYAVSSIKGEYTKIPVFNKVLDKTGVYNQLHSAIEIKVNRLIPNNFTAGGGTRFEYLKYSPQIKTYPQLKGNSRFITSFLDLHFNNLEMPIYPNYGNIIDIEFGVHYAINSTYHFKENLETQYTPEFKNKPYYTVKYSSAHYLPVGKHAIFLKLNTGIHFGNKQPLLNDFIIGGNTNVMRNQIPFPGFSAGSIYSSSVFSTQLGFQYNLSQKFVLTGISSFLKYDFISSDIQLQDSNRESSVAGIAMVVGYKSFLGPIEAMVMYNSINHKVSPGFSLGYSLNF